MVNDNLFESGINWVTQIIENTSLLDFYNENQTAVVTTMGCATIASLVAYYLTSTGGERKQVKKVKHKPIKKVILTPRQKIDNVLTQYEKIYLPLIASLKSTVIQRITDIQSQDGYDPDDFKQGKSYKDALEYQSKYFEESLLKLIMSLDGVDTNADSQLKIDRKQAIKTLQSGHKEVDNLRNKIEMLKAKSVEY